ncbi:hypothetical protein MGU_11008 [Metarhizium guizhouense ARSEF 977]|uniref:Integrase core domain-containing protein n=1 Tax=Metarhizium guizhouense (strain ARSEF 977) TaxID=1276136 RepID=A0A0B4G4W5_METGA|nr:hypothetical protein MGU_11008 [Metarhizium guizhouense ARSEF 977]
MPRPPNPIDQYRDYVSLLYLSGVPRSKISESPKLIEAIRDLVFRVGLTEKQTLAVLQRQGWPITKRGLKRIRLHLDRRWCIDGHDKLKAYGFEIYAVIDAYSRNIIWFYVGHSATTALSVLKQYLAACDAYGFRLWYLQADRGRKMLLVAAAH